METASTSRKNFPKRKKIAERNERRKLNSDIFRLRKMHNGNILAEKRLEKAIAEMIKQNKDEDHISSELLRRHQQHNLEDKANEVDERLEQMPDVVSFHAVISSYAKDDHKDRRALKRAIGLLERMKVLSASFPHLSPTIFSYNAVMEAYCNHINKNNIRIGYQQRLSENQNAILRLYHELQEVGLSPNTYTRNLILASMSTDSEEWRHLEGWAYRYLDGSGDNIIPDRKTYNTIFRTYSFGGNANKAEKMLRMLLKWYVSQDHSQRDEVLNMKPSKTWFHCVLKALAVSDSKFDEPDETIMPLLMEMKEFDLQPDTLTYNHVLNVYANHGSADLAISLMKKVEETSNVFDALDSVSYTTVIKSFATAQKEQRTTKTQSSLTLAENATMVFERMLERSISPTTVTYNTLIGIWVCVGTRDGLNRAEDLLNQMRHPNSVSYSTIIYGWSKTRFPEASSRAQKLFKEVLRLPSNRLSRNFSMTMLCNSVISAYAKSGDEDAPKCVDSLLARLEGRFLSGDTSARPDKITFLGIFDTYAKSGVSNAEERCDVLLDRMSHYRDMTQATDLEPDRVIYNAVLNALAKSYQPDVIPKVEDVLAMMESSSDINLRPDIVTYATVIDCFTKCSEMSLKRADEILRFVEGTFRGGDTTLKPNAVFYSAVLQAWAKTATVEGAEKAENLLQRNVDLFAQGFDYAKPHTIVFNAVIDAVARSNIVGAGARAEDLLEDMERLYQLGDEDMRPSRRSFNAVILAYRNEGNASKKAEALLYRMEEMAASGWNEVRPNVVTYNNVIAAVVEDSDNENCAEKAQALLDQMEACGIKPNGRTYSPVIEAWLRRNDEKGYALADVMLTQFLDNVEKSKQQNVKARKESLYEDAVWNVINAYRDNSDNEFYSQLASRGWISSG